MNYNLLGYGIFILIIVIIIKVVGKICYTNGNIFVAALIPGQVDLCRQINYILLVAYYLVNIGYAATTFVSWELIGSLSQLIEVIAFRVSLIIVILSVLHYINILLLTISVQKLIKTT